MSWEPDTEELRLGIARKEINDLKSQTSFSANPISVGSSSNAMGSNSGTASMNQGSNGDVVKDLTNAITTVSENSMSWIVGAIDAVGSLFTVKPAPTGEPSVDCATMRTLSGGVDGQKITLKPEKNKKICLMHNPVTNTSAIGNLLLGGVDVTITDPEMITLRFTTEVGSLYKDSYLNNVLPITPAPVPAQNPPPVLLIPKGGWLIESIGEGNTIVGSNRVVKDPVKVTSTGNNIAHPLWGSTIDGIAMTVGDRFLVKDQTNTVDNGIYIWASGSASTRSTDMASGSTQKEGTMTYIQDGTEAERLYAINIGGNTIVMGTSANTWGEIGNAGANQTLSNLTSPTSVNQSLIPDGDEVEDLGSTSNVWRRLYAKDIYSTGTIRTEALDNELEFYAGGAKSFAISRASSAPFTGVAEVWGAGASLKTMSNTVGVNGTEIGGLYFDGYDSTVSRETFASLTAVTTTVTDGSEDGLLKLKVKRSGTTKEMFEVNTMGIRLPTASLATPSTDGSIYLSGTDIKVRTGGTTVNLSNIVDILPLSNVFTGAVNTFSNATGTFQASTPIVNLGTGSGNISLLGITTLSGRLQMSGNTIFWDTGFAYGMTGGSSAGGMDFQIPSTAGHGFDFQLGTGVSGNPQMGIANDEVGLNVALDMNLNPIKFQAITGVATPTGLEKRFLFSDSANSDELSVKLPSGSIVSLEGSGADILPLSNTFTGSVNSFSNATGTFSALTPTVNLGTGTGNINILGLTTGLSGRLQMNGNPVYWDSGLTYSITGGSSAGGIDFQIPSTAGHGFDFQIGTGVSGNPQMGITNTEVGLNVPLDMNLSYIKFQAITGVSAPTGLEKRFLFSDSANSDHLSVRTSSGIVDLESGGGGTSFIGFTADDNLNMGTFDVTNIDRMLFEGALGGSLVSGDVGITSDADGMIFNVPTSDDYNFSVAMATPFLTFNSTGFLYSGGTFQANTGVVNLGTGAGSINLLGDTASTGKIDMNANEIRFDGMVDPSQIVGEPQLFADSSNSDHLSIMSGDGTLYDLESSSSGANTSLSNLSTPTSINQTLIPDLDNLYSLGTSTTQWRDLHIDGTAYLDAIGFGTDSCTLPTNNGNNGEVLTTNGSGTLTWSTPSSSGANTALSNLSGVSINASLTPASTSWSLGSTSKFWGSAFISGSIYFGDTTKRIYNSGSDIITNGASGGDIKFQEAGTNFFVCDGGSDEIIFSRGVEFNEDTLVDGGSMIRSHDSIECGFSVSKLADVASIGTEGTMQIPWSGTFSGSRSATDTDFGNGHACIGIMESAGTPYLMVKSSNGGWYGIGLSLYYA